MLSLLTTACYTPPAVRIEDAAKGLDLNDYRGWPQFCQASENEHPSTMAVQVANEALSRAGVSAKDLRYILFNGISRDYPPSWSVSVEVMKQLKTSDSCLGIDYTVGCLGTLIGLHFLSKLLQKNEDGYGLIVCSEKWAYTVDRRDPESKTIWGHSDGAAALLVGPPGTNGAFGKFVDVAFSSHGQFNDLVRVKYGGTRFPVPPASEPAPFKRILAAVPAAEISQIYQNNLERAYQTLLRKHPRKFDGLVINQMPRGILMRIKDLFGMDDSQICITGDKYGHVGSADILIGLESTLNSRPAPGSSILMAATSPSQFGVGLIDIA